MLWLLASEEETKMMKDMDEMVPKGPTWSHDTVFGQRGTLLIDLIDLAGQISMCK